MMGNPFMKPSEVYEDFMNCYASPLPAKKRQCKETNEITSFRLALKEDSVPIIVDKSLPDADYLVHVGEQMDLLKKKIEYHQGIVLNLEAKRDFLCKAAK